MNNDTPNACSDGKIHLVPLGEGIGVGVGLKIILSILTNEMSYMVVLKCDT